VGSRFWPASTPTRPKQLLPLVSERPLIVDTVERARGLVPDQRIRILAGQRLVAPFRAALPGLPSEAYLVEPRARGTAPVLTWAAYTLAREDPSAVLVSLHADHLVRPEGAFLELLRGAASLADGDRLLVTVGAVPDRPEIGYGYIQPGEALAAPGIQAVRVAAFHEKPDAATAARYLERGYLWNTGIFVWRADVFLEEVRTHAPELAEHLPRLDAGDVEGFFAACPVTTVDVAVLERSRSVACVRCTFTWDDVGGWEALGRGREADEHGNVGVGEVVAVDASDNVAYAEGAPIVLYGVNGLVVVRTAGMTLVASRAHTGRLKELLARLPDALQDPDTGA
jgi:mannose-1-phosphate guanylyltransferase